MKSTMYWKHRIVAVMMTFFLLLLITGCGDSGGFYSPLIDKSSTTSGSAVLPPFNTTTLPLTVTGSNYNGFGAFTFDADGNLLFAVNSVDQIRSINRITGAETTIATGVSGGHTLLGMTYDQNSIYIGDNEGNIFRVNPTTGASTLLATMPSGYDVCGLVIAPASYSPYGGQLIAATYSGNIYAVDQSQASPVPVQIANIGSSYANSLVFGSNGTLYVTDDQKVVTVTAAGLVADFATGFSEPDGLAIDNDRGLLYVADSGNRTLYSVTIPGGAVSTVATPVNFDRGWWPTPIIYDTSTNILLMGITSGAGMAIIFQAL